MHKGRNQLDLQGPPGQKWSPSSEASQPSAIFLAANCSEKRVADSAQLKSMDVRPSLREDNAIHFTDSGVFGTFCHAQNDVREW